MSHKIRATTKRNRKLSACSISILTSMTVLTRITTANYENPIFAQNVNSQSPNSVSK